ncbi:Rhs family protein-like precursor [uncultured Gammaproteobacteria bacterium]|nr:Rhs family protein-like precursor [uncultured Gammaproteobacteria bacterium]
MAYTAFGERRKGDWRVSDPLLPIILALTNRGFTGHEHIDEMGLIHMNGRAYDPQIGRFLSADPYIQAPYNTQSYNRYSYVMNNPLKYTDPDGYRSLALIAATITKAIVVNVTNIFVQMAIAYAVTYSVTYIETGSAKAAKAQD